MGTVYRATDTKLGREAAIRILPKHFVMVPGKTQISSGAGQFPEWSSQGRAVVLRKRNGAVDGGGLLSQRRTFSASKPRVWHAPPVRLTGNRPNDVIAPDGKRMIVISGEGENGSTESSARVTFVTKESLHRGVRAS